MSERATTFAERISAVKCWDEPRVSVPLELVAAGRQQAEAARSRSFPTPEILGAFFAVSKDQISEIAQTRANYEELSSNESTCLESNVLEHAEWWRHVTGVEWGFSGSPWRHRWWFTRRVHRQRSEWGQEFGLSMTLVGTVFGALQRSLFSPWSPQKKTSGCSSAEFSRSRWEEGALSGFCGCESLSLVCQLLEE